MKFLLTITSAITIFGIASQVATAQMLSNPEAAAPSIPSSYNLKVGEVYLRTGAGVYFSYNDNISLRNSDKQEDFIIAPSAQFALYLPLTKKNAFRFALDVGGQFYMDHDEFNSFVIYPNGNNELELYAETENWVFRLRDSFSLSVNPLVNNTVAESGDLRQFQNAFTLSADADYGLILAGANYSHLTYLFSGSEFDYLNRQADILTAYLGFRISAPLILGVEYSANYNYYDGDALNDSFGQTASAYAQFTLTKNISGRVSAGYGWNEFDGGGDFQDDDDFGDFIFSASLSHEINKFMRHTIAGSKAMTPGVTSNFQDSLNLVYNMSFDLSRHWTTDILFNWTDYESSRSNIPEDASIYRVGVGTAYQLTKSLNATFRYDYMTKDSNLQDQDFTQNVYTLGLNYSF